MSDLSNKVRVAIVLTKNVVKIYNQSRLVGCQVSRKLVALVCLSPDSSSLVRGRIVLRLV